MDNKSRNKGEGNGMARLKVEQVREIKRLIQVHWGHEDIAYRFGVSRQTISAIANGTRWGHVSIEEEAVE